MGAAITIDAVGRLVIPKSLRDRLGLTAGTTLLVTEDDGRLVLSPEHEEPTLVERDGFLIVHVGGAVDPALDDGSDARNERLRGLVDYAMRR